jgi:hypothetical protein
MFLGPITYFRYIFHVKIPLFVSLNLSRIRIRLQIRIVSALWIRIRIEIKSWIQIRIETNADSQTVKNPPQKEKTGSEYCFFLN